MSLQYSVVFLVCVFSCTNCVPLQPSEKEDYIGKYIRCSPQEKLCFKYGRILNQEDGKCYPIEEYGPCSFESLFFLDKEALLKYGKYVGKCVFNDEWPKPWFEEEEDGTHVLVSDECKSIERNIFGEYICLRDVPSRTEVQIRQPEEEGQCRIPNFLNVVPYITHTNVHEVLYPRPCNISEHRCLVDKKIYWPQDGQCYDPLVRGPCAEEEWLLLDEELFLRDNTIVTPVCRPMPCARNQVLMDFDGKCYPEDDVLTALCVKTGVLVTNVFGRSACGDRVQGHNVGEPTFDPDSGTCYTLDPPPFTTLIGIFASEECSPSNLGACPKKVKLQPGPIYSGD